MTTLRFWLGQLADDAIHLGRRLSRNYQVNFEYVDYKVLRYQGSQEKKGFLKKEWTIVSNGTEKPSNVRSSVQWI